MSASSSTAAVVDIAVAPLTAEGFAPFGVVLTALYDGTPVTVEEAQLDLSGGAPRFYLMRTVNRPLAFNLLTRHRRTTQTLMALGGGSWVLIVAPPTDNRDERSRPAPETVRAFEVPGNVAVTLYRGCWHSGPHYSAPEMSFVNLELADTNQVDHQTYHIADELGVRFSLSWAES